MSSTHHSRLDLRASRGRSAGLLWLAAALLVPLPAAPSDVSVPPPMLTPEQAVEEAISNNLGLLAERVNLTVAEAAVITARLRPNPVLSLSADHLDFLGTGVNALNNGGPPGAAWGAGVPVDRGPNR